MELVGKGCVFSELKKRLYFMNNRYYNISTSMIRSDYTIMQPVNYQLSAFGSFSAPPTPENIITLMQEFKKTTGIDFLPNIINSQQVEIPANRITTISNLGFVTNDQQYNVVTLNERIDVTYNRVQDEVAVDSFFEIAEKVLSVILKHFNEKANRLATNIEYIVSGDHSRSEQLCHKLIYTLPSSDEKQMLEWAYRTNSLSTISINGREENLNTITSILTAVNQKKGPIIVCHIDINTMPFLTESRFSADDLDSFVNGTLEIAKKIAEDTEELVSSDKQ